MQLRSSAVSAAITFMSHLRLVHLLSAVATAQEEISARRFGCALRSVEALRSRLHPPTFGGGPTLLLRSAPEERTDAC